MRSALPVIVMALAVACGGKSGTGPGADGGTDGGGDGPGGGCQTALDCTMGQVCDPATHACTGTLACQSHDQCGPVAHCTSGGTCAPSTTGSPCSGDENCRPDEECIAGVCGCNGQPYTANRVQPNVLIVLDRSSSMNEDIGGGTKWEIAKQAITDLLAAEGGQIRFGLAMYPGTNSDCSQGSRCTAGRVFVDPAASTTARINMTLGAAGTCDLGTPTAEILASLIDYAPLEDTMHPDYILLITDGQSNCDDPVPEVTALAGETPPVHTFVVGFGDGVDPDELNALAEAGGTARPGGPPSYYEATDPMSLAQAFEAIAGSVLSCSYTLSTVPPDPTQLYVYVDDMPVARDPGAGWDYDAATNQVTFHGAVCNRLLGGQATEVVIVYGCPLDPG